MNITQKLILIFIINGFIVTNVFAAGGIVKSPTGTEPDRYVYYPGTEKLSKNEIQVTACGTGLPAARRSQHVG